MRYRLANHDEVCHFWANEVQSEGAACNMFFENKTLYSYGRHFAIAKHYPNNLILFTDRVYSVSTSKHISKARYAIPMGRNVIYCYNPESPNDKGNLTSAISEIEWNLKKAIKARTRKQDYMHAAEYAYNQVVQLKTIFKIKGWKIPAYNFTIPENVMEIIREKEKKAEAKKEKRCGKTEEAGQAR